MVPIGGKPIIWHIMNQYSAYGINEFVIALGYKAEVIREYFLNFRVLNSDFTINLKNGDTEVHEAHSPNWRVTLVDTGLDTLTGSRLRRLQPFLGEESFMLTYGDGLSNVDIGKLLDFHKRQGGLATLTAVRPAAKFGELSLEDGRVLSFEEKPNLNTGWINGGFMVIEPEFFDYLPSENVMLEREPLSSAARDGRLRAYEHDGFWQCMDTKRDMENLQSLWESGNPPWLN